MLNLNITKILLVFCLFLSLELSAQTVPYTGERIVVVADGNEHGKDDWGATPLTLALIASKEIQDQVMVYAFSSHTWGSNKSHFGADGRVAK